MSVSPERGDSHNQSDDSFPRTQDSSFLSKLIPILVALILGMLVMLIVVYFFPHEHGQSDVQSAQTSSNEDSPPGNDATPSAPPLAGDIGQSNANTGRVEVRSTTTSGYSVAGSGAPRAVDFSGADDPRVQADNQPASVPEEQASTSPCVDPPSAKGRAYRVVDH